jgi:hypothetical protein
MAEKDITTSTVFDNLNRLHRFLKYAILFIRRITMNSNSSNQVIEEEEKNVFELILNVRKKYSTLLELASVAPDPDEDRSEIDFMAQLYRLNYNWSRPHDLEFSARKVE